MSNSMSNTETAILGLVLWSLTLLVGLASYRTMQTLTAGKSANAFDPTGLDLGSFGQRLTRAHANAYEFIPLALAVLILAVATGQSQATDGTALVLLGCRIGQSVVHLISTSVVAVLIRFVILFIPQIVVVAWWCLVLMDFTP